MVQQRFLSCLVIAAISVAAQQARCEQAIRLVAAAPTGAVEAVSVELELGGQLQLPSTQEESVENTPQITANAKLEYDEARLPGGETRSVRYYRTVEGTATIAGRERPLALRDSRRLVLANGKLLTGVEGPLDREELELLQTVADSLATGGLLPGRQVEIGDTWDHDVPTMEALLGVDSVGVCEVTSVLVEANEHYARCQVAGTVHGVVDGSSVELELDGIYLYRRATEGISHLNLAVRETRAIGPATPGCTMVTKVRMKRDLADDPQLTADRIAKAQAAGAGAIEMVQLASDHLGFTTSTDHRWYVTGSLGDSMTLRRVTPEGLVAHGNLVRLEAKPLDAQAALGEFRRDVMRSLSQHSAGLKSESQWVNRNGCRVMEIVATGTIEDVQVEWHCYQIAPPEGDEQLHRLALSLMIESGQLERLADQDRVLVDQLTLLPRAQQAQRPTRQK
ncbi:hypothetical protein [Aeoliella sp.]|uniref:hypothetical protein n=1 Tax=Aeoliella sp. TaxID=2795800 RepID=UPI003CCC018B